MNPRKQTRTGRAAATAAALFCSVGLLFGGESPAGVASTRAPAPEVSVTRSAGGAFQVEASFRLELPPEVAWGVLTDYDNLASFVPSLRSSSLFRDGSGRRLVIQEAVGRVGPFSRKLHVVLEVTEEAPIRIDFRDLCGRSFDSYVGRWTIDPDGSGVQVSYRLEARPRSAPPLFGRSILASNARGLLEDVRGEMLRRARAGASPDLVR